MTWRCFHCDEVFTDKSSAAEHFGKNEMQDPACTIDIAEYRRMEEIHRRHCEEDTDLHRELYSARSAIAVALLREEEKGYARGIRDTVGVVREANAAYDESLRLHGGIAGDLDSFKLRALENFKDKVTKACGVT